MRVRLKGLNHVRKRLADGTYRDYYYAWKGGPPVRGEPGTPEFIASFEAAAVQGSQRRARNDLQSLIDQYLDSSDFLKLKDETKRTYRNQIKKIEAAFADLPIAALKDRRVRGDFLKWRDDLGATAPRQADLAIRVLQRILSWAYDRGITDTNPLQRVRLMHRGTRRDQIWSPEQIEAFMAKAPKRLQLALQLALWTGQRQGDLLRLTWSAYDGTHIRLQQSKGSARVAVPLARSLKQLFDEAKTELKRPDEEEGSLEDLTILVSPAGTPWRKRNFSGQFKKACETSGVEGVTFHDLRGTAVMRMAVAGASVPEIATVTGHSLKDVEAILDAHYFKRDSALATSAIRKVERQTKRPTKLPTAR